VRETELMRAEAIGRDNGSVVSLAPLRQLGVGVILVGSTLARERIERGVYPAIEARVAGLGSAVLATRYVDSEEHAVAEALSELRAAGAQLLIIAGETSIMDRDDVTPQGIRLAGGQIEHYGAPVEPGNLLLLAYLDDLPVLGAPGCVRSRDINIVDLLLPRLLAGEYVTRRDIVELGHGGLLG
jgi:molybdenum cofactor cytidylyltransferase